MLALSIRFLYLWEYSSCPTFRVPVVDSETYDRHARLLAVEGEIDRRFFWQGFFYPFYLAGAYALTGGSILWARIIQAMIGSALCMLVYRLGSEIFNRKTGLVAGILAALYGPSVFFECELLSTGWAAVWSVVLLLLILAAGMRHDLFLYVFSGIAGGLSIITRATFVPFLAVSFVWLLYRFQRSRRSPKATALRAAVCVSGFLLVAIPVSVMCYRETGNFNPLPQSGPINLFIGNNPDTDRTIMIRPGAEWRELTRMPELHDSKSEHDDRRYFMGLFWNYVMLHPGDYLRGIAGKTVRFMSSRELPRNVDVYTARGYSRIFSVLTWKASRFGFPFGVLLPFAMLGLIRRRREIPAPVWFYLVLYPLSIILVFVTSRYRTPVMPVIVVPAAAGAMELYGVFKKRRWKMSAIMTAAVVVIALISSAAGPFVTEDHDYEAEMHCSVGFELGKQGRLEEAEVQLREALELEPGYGDAHKHLGLVLSGQRRHEEALKHLEQALKQKPESYLLRYYIGVTLLNLGRDEEAREHLADALARARTAKESSLVRQIEQLPIVSPPHP